MLNRQFHWQLRKLTDENGKTWTVTLIAYEMFISRARLTDVINNKSGHGGQTRPKVVRFLKRKFPAQFHDLLKALKWNELGEIIPEPKVTPGTIGST